MGVDTTVEEFQQAQGIDDDIEMEVVAEATLAAERENSSDSGENADTEVE